MEKNLILSRGFYYKYFSDSLYGDTNLSRFYMSDPHRGNKEYFNKYIDSLKKIWAQKDLLIVEGSHTRMGIGNDFFDGARSTRRILCPNKNAFSYYTQIKNTVIENASKLDLIICALGPTATVLSADLIVEGYRALDLGHIDIEYEWWERASRNNYRIPGKEFSEVPGQFQEVDSLRPENVVAVVKE